MGDARYTVKNIETIAESSDIRARRYTLAPDDVIPWHYHSTVTDWYFCLGGTLRIETRAAWRGVAHPGRSVCDRA